MKQASLELNLSAKKTRKREFLAQMERVVPWAALVPARVDRRNHHNLAFLHQRLDHSGLRVISLVCNDCSCLGVLQQHVCAFRVTGLSGREVKTRRIA